MSEQSNRERASDLAADHTNEDVAVVREREEARCDACAASWQFKDEGGKWCAYDFVPRLQARLEAWEANAKANAELAMKAEAERDEARADAENAWAQLDAERNARVKDNTYLLNKCEALKADAERLAEAGRRLYREHKWDEADFEDGAALWEFREALADILAAHTPHLTGPKHKPTGTFYTVEDAVEDAKGSSAGSHKQHGQRANSSDKARPADDDAGPPAPGEGDDLPNPEVGMEC